MNYAYDLDVPGTSDTDCDQKANACGQLVLYLSGPELAKLAQVVATQPKKVALAKKMLGL